MNKLIFTAAAAGKKALDLIEENQKLVQPTIGADTFNVQALEDKLTNDANFLVGLGKSLNESDSIEYFKTLETILENTSSLYKEVDMKPRTISQAVDTQELTESITMEIYSKNFTESINSEYGLPLLEGKLLEKYPSETRLLTEAAVASGLSKEMDTEKFLKYALFENTLVKNTFHLLVPKILEERADTFIKTQTPEYFEVFDKNALTLKNNIEESCIKLSSLIGPKLFEESTGVDNCTIFAGISSALK